MRSVRIEDATAMLALAIVSARARAVLGLAQGRVLALGGHVAVGDLDHHAADAVRAAVPAGEG